MNLFLAMVPIGICSLGAAIDLRTREIPNTLPLVLLLLTPINIWFLSETVWWYHLLGGILALSIGLLVSFGDRFGGGDVKLFAALGTWFGSLAVIPLAMWIALAGLPLAMIAAARKQKDFAYGPAILVGVCVHVFAPTLLQRVAGF